MVEIGIADINKTPSIIDKLDDVAKITNKKTKDIKGFFIPYVYKNFIEEAIEKIEYERFLKRNSGLISESEEDDTILDGLDARY